MCAFACVCVYVLQELQREKSQVEQLQSTRAKSADSTEEDQRQAK